MPPMDISWVGPGSWDQLFPGASVWDVLLCLGSLRVSGMDTDPDGVVVEGEFGACMKEEIRG